MIEGIHTQTLEDIHGGEYAHGGVSIHKGEYTWCRIHMVENTHNEKYIG